MQDKQDNAEEQLKAKIKEHYDELSPYYHDLWGRHIHHGYWITGQESKEDAQTQLIELLAKEGGLRSGCHVLDVGCGVGGTSIWLSKKFNAQVTGVTLSSVQVSMAQRLAHQEGTASLTTFLLMDADKGLDFMPESFDFVWICEVLSHFAHKDKFFQNAFNVLSPKGKIVLVDWFKAPNLSQEMENRYIKPIEAGMLLPQLNTQDEYVRLMERVGFSIVSRKDISENCSKTWYKIDSKLCSFNKKTLGGIYAWKIFLIPPFGKLHFQKDGRCYLLYEPSRTCGPGTPPETFAMAIL
jgi:tocopherol O-methyltransferase